MTAAFVASVIGAVWCGALGVYCIRKGWLRLALICLAACAFDAGWAVFVA